MKTIIEMAREAGAAVGSPAPNTPEIIFPQCLDVQRFAELVRADEIARMAEQPSPLPVQAEQEPVTWSARAADVQEVCAKIEKYGLMMGEGDVGPYIAWMLKSLNALADAASLQPEERNYCPRCGKRTVDLTTIHTCTPPQRKWVNLTVDELIDLEHKHLSHENLTRAIEAKLKEKNT